MRLTCVLSAILAVLPGGLLPPGRASAGGLEPVQHPQPRPAAVVRFQVPRPVYVAPRLPVPNRGPRGLAVEPVLRGVFSTSPVGPALSARAGLANDPCENIVSGIAKGAGIIVGGVVGGAVGYHEGGNGGLGMGILVGAPAGQLVSDAIGNFVAASVCKDRASGEPTPPSGNGLSLDEIIGPVSKPPSASDDVNALLRDLTEGLPSPPQATTPEAPGMMSSQDIQDLVNSTTPDTPAVTPPSDGQDPSPAPAPSTQDTPNPDGGGTHDPGGGPRGPAATPNPEGTGPGGPLGIVAGARSTRRAFGPMLGAPTRTSVQGLGIRGTRFLGNRPVTGSTLTPGRQ